MLSKEYAKARLVFLTVDPNDISPEKFCSSIEPCSFWALDMVVVQWEEQEKCVIKGLKITLGKIKFISFLAAQCLALHPWALHACLHHHQWFVWPLLLWVLMILSNIDSCSVLHLSPTWYFLEILGISIQMAFPEFGQISSFSRGRTPFLELKHYF